MRGKLQPNSQHRLLENEECVSLCCGSSIVDEVCVWCQIRWDERPAHKWSEEKSYRQIITLSLLINSSPANTRLVWLYFISRQMWGRSQQIFYISFCCQNALNSSVGSWPTVAVSPARDEDNPDSVKSSIPILSTTSTHTTSVALRVTTHHWWVVPVQETQHEQTWGREG